MAMPRTLVQFFILMCVATIAQTAGAPTQLYGLNELEDQVAHLDDGMELVGSRDSFLQIPQIPKKAKPDHTHKKPLTHEARLRHRIKKLKAKADGIPPKKAKKDHRHKGPLTHEARLRHRIKKLKAKADATKAHGSAKKAMSKVKAKAAKAAQALIAKAAMKEAKAFPSDHQLRQRKRAKQAADQVTELAHKAGMKRIPAGNNAADTYDLFTKKLKSREKAEEAPRNKESGIKESYNALKRIEATAKEYNEHKHPSKGFSSALVLLAEAMSDNSNAEQEGITKVKQKASMQLKAVVKRHMASIVGVQGRLKEKIEKANKKLELEEKNAMAFKTKAMLQWKSEWEATGVKTTKKWMALRSRAQALLASEQAKATQNKQERTAYWASQTASIRSAMTRLQESQNAWYMSQVSTLEQSKGSKVAKAKSEYEKALAALRMQITASNQEAQSQISRVRKKFDSLISKARSRLQDSERNIRRVEEEAVRKGKARIDQAKAKMKKDVGEARDKEKVATANGKSVLETAESRKKELKQEQSVMKKFKATYQKKLTQLKTAAKVKMQSLKQSEDAKLKQVDKKIKQVQQKKKQDVKKAMKKISKDEVSKKQKQLKWMAKAQRHSKQNCIEARQAAQLKAKAAKLAAHGVARDAQALYHETNSEWRDAVSKSSELKKKRDARAKQLAKSTKAAAVAMVKQMYFPKGKGPKGAPCPDSDVSPPPTTSSKLPDTKQLDSSTQQFAKSMIPYVGEEKNVKMKLKKRIHGKEVARKKTWVWANNHAVKLAKKAMMEAEKICDQQRAWFEQVQANVRRRLGESTGSKQQETSQAQAKAKSKEAKKVKALLNTKKVLRKTEQTEISALAEASAATQSTFKTQKTTQISIIRKKISNLSESAGKLETKGKLDLKLAKEKMESRVNEAKKLEQVSVKEAEKEEAGARSQKKAERLKLKADTGKSVDQLRSQMATSITQIKKSTVGLSTAKDDSQLRKQRDVLIGEAKSQYNMQSNKAKSDMKTKLNAALSIMTQKITKNESKLKQETEAINAALEKAKAKEKAEEIKIDGIRSRFKSAKAQSEKDAVVMSKEKASSMLKEAKEKHRMQMKKIREWFNGVIVKDSKVYQGTARDTGKQLVGNIA